MKTILATAYAINPFKGSEDGMGWNFVCQIARFNRVIAVTRENNRERIEKYMFQNPSPDYANIQFLYYDLPYWMRFWKKGGRGAMLYYWMWQRGMPSFVKSQKVQYDIVHNLNFHNDWTPSYLWKLGKPMVWGPVGHHPLIPAQYLSPYPLSYWLKDRMAWLVKNFFWEFSPALKTTIRKADKVLCMNSEVAPKLRLSESQIVSMPSVATENLGWEEQRNSNQFTILTAGRLVPLKGYDLSILAFSQFLQTVPLEARAKVQLLVIGNGEESERYRKMVSDLHLEANVRFIDWVLRADLLEMYKAAAIFLFPSHEGAGMVVAEALSFGVPVVCLQNCGPGEFLDAQSGIAVAMGDYDSTVNRLSDALRQLYEQPDFHEKLRKGARARFLEHFEWGKRGEQLKNIYNQLS